MDAAIAGAQLNHDNQVKMFKLQQEYQNQARWQDANQRALHQRQHQENEYALRAHQSRLERANESYYTPGSWIQTHLPNKPAPFIIISTNTRQEFNPFQKEAPRIAPLGSVARRLRHYNFQYEHDLLSIITTLEPFASESDVLTFYYRELNCPCIILYAEFSGSALLINALYAGMLEGQTQLDETTSSIDFSPRITTLWEISYNRIAAIKADYIKTSNNFGWLDVIEIYTETFVGLNAQTLLDEYFQNVPANIYQSQTSKYLKDKENELKQIGLWNNFEKIITERQTRIKQQQAILLNKLKESQILSDKNARYMGNFSPLRSKTVVEVVGNKWSFRGVDNTLQTPYLVFRNSGHPPVFTSGTLLTKNKDGLYGFLNTEGYLIIPFNYEDADYMSENQAAVCKDGKWGLVGLNASLTVTLKYDDLYSPRGGFASFKRNGKWGLLAIDGTEVIAPEFEIVRVAEYDRVIVKNKKWGLISVEGEILLNTEFDDILNLNHNFCLLSKETNSYVYHLPNKLLIELRDDRLKNWEFTPLATTEINKFQGSPWQAYSFYELSDSFYLLSINRANLVGEKSQTNQSYLLKKESNTFHLSKSADVEISESPDIPLPNSMPIPAMSSTGKGFLSPSLAPLIPCMYQAIMPFSQGLAAVKHGDYWGFVDLANTFIVPAIYEQVKSFSDGLAAVRVDGKWGFIDLEGNTIIDCVFQEVVSFHANRAFARYTNRDSWAILDNMGSILVEAKV
ncbi:WG repeat-containing protein [Larkinella bovis]|uniref:WG repeat-containing protein n=1 Tax=Larkinella bovis TaxID=683041 RepID=A0ABW0IK26_9BACT